MIFWIQTRFKKHTKVVLAFLLVVVAIPFVFSINGGGLAWWDRDRAVKRRDFFGYNIASQPVMRRLNGDVRLSRKLRLGYLMPEGGAMAETAGLQRAACLALADRFGTADSDEAQVWQEIQGMRLFGDAHGVFAPKRYEAFLTEIRADAQFKEADLARVIAEDIRIRQIEGRTKGPYKGVTP